MLNSSRAKLILENGRIFDGYSMGFEGIALGEVCFNTGMTGYQEILTDPSYCGQLITMTYPHIGNYGVNSEDVESDKIQASGLIVKDGSSFYSNFRAEESLDNYLKNNEIVGIQGIDTRSLVRCIRNEGAMNGIISSTELNDNKLKNMLSSHPSMEGMDLTQSVTCDKSYKWKNNKKTFKVAVVDYGIKYNILRLLNDQDCDLTIFPSNVTSKEILDLKPDGIFLSNGPGDPSAVSYAIKTVKNVLAENIPIFGICLGHQILCLAIGAKTYKLKFGHRGCNHPVKNHETKIIEITSQNHGFSVDKNTIPSNAQITHTSLNDNTVEGIELKDSPAFSIQYHPESSPGPHDSRYLFSKFKQLMKKYKKVNSNA